MDISQHEIDMRPPEDMTLKLMAQTLNNMKVGLGQLFISSE